MRTYTIENETNNISVHSTAIYALRCGHASSESHVEQPAKAPSATCSEKPASKRRA
jgi:hypothetical protein